MKYLLSSAVVVVTLCNSYSARADEVTLVAPGGMRCPIERMTPDFERKTGHKVKATIGAGGATHQQVVRGEPFDVPIAQRPFPLVLASGHVIVGTETPLATAVGEVKGLDHRPDPHEMTTIGQSWRPWRSVAARLLWHDYLGRRGRTGQP